LTFAEQAIAPRRTPTDETQTAASSVWSVDRDHHSIEKALQHYSRFPAHEVAAAYHQKHATVRIPAQPA